MKDKKIHLYQISYLETFNKYLLTFTSSSFPVLWFFIQAGKGWVNGFKFALAAFGISLFLTMLVLIIVCDYPDPKGCLKNFIFTVDWIAFIIFTIALAFTY